MEGNDDSRISSSYFKGTGEVERSGTEEPPEDCCLPPYSQTSHNHILQLQTKSLYLL
jgi:predicted nucleotide-binding protein (sugar kinase/HSP70/actin superfamily)